MSPVEEVIAELQKLSSNPIPYKSWDCVIKEIKSIKRSYGTCYLWAKGKQSEKIEAIIIQSFKNVFKQQKPITGEEYYSFCGSPDGFLYCQEIPNEELYIFHHKKMSTIETLFDDESTRKKFNVMNKTEVMLDDARNNDYISFWCALDDFLEWGKSYRITVEEVE